MREERRKEIRHAVIDTLKDQNGGTPLTELRERVCSVHLFESEEVRTVIMELIGCGTLKVNTDRKIYRG